MNSALITHISRIHELRKELWRRSGIKKEELMNIWSRWIITHRSLFSQSGFFLPSDDEYDCQLLVELQSKGCECSNEVYDFLLSECRSLNMQYNPVADTATFGLHGIVPVYKRYVQNDIATGAGNPPRTSAVPVDSVAPGRTPGLLVRYNTYDLPVIYECGNLTYKVQPSVHRKLMGLYCGQPETGRADTPLRDGYVWLVLAMYDLLEGKGLQWALPAAVMNVLQQYLGCYTELFASPINSCHTQYYSLFPWDKYFGSRGNFFTAPDSDFESGCFQVNPPFIIPLFIKASERILQLLERADSSGKDLTFVYIMPEWDKFDAYDVVADSRFCLKQITLEPQGHYYYQYSNDSYIRARFGTKILFMSTDSRCYSPDLEKALYYSFSGPYRWQGARRF